MDMVALALGRFVAALAASYEVAHHFAFDVVVELPVRFAGITDAEVATSPAKVRVYFAYRLADGFAVLARGAQFPKALPRGGQGFLGGLHIQIATLASVEVAVVAEYVY